MLNTDSLERESWRVMEDDSKDEKSGREVGNWISCGSESRCHRRCKSCCQSVCVGH